MAARSLAPARRAPRRASRGRVGGAHREAPLETAPAPEEPKTGRAKRKAARVAKPRRRWRRIAVFAFCLLVLFGGAGAAAFYFLAKIPLPESLPPAQTSFIYAADGTQLAELHAEQDRTVVTYRDISPAMIQATVAAEDRNYFKHKGIDVPAILRAAWADLRDKPLQGGSTIPQQYVKNVFLSTDRTLTRKVKEAVIAVKLSRKYSKEKILELYLNTIYFGRGAYGVETASETYFGKAAKGLTVPEAATLAGLIRAPETADPVLKPVEALRRRNQVLDAMVETDALTPAEAGTFKGQPVVALPKKPTTTIAANGGAAYFTEYVRHTLVKKYGRDKVYGGGLRVTTTIDMRLQSYAEKAARDILGRPKDPDVALVCLDLDGRVVAMVGGRDFNQSQVNLAVGREGGGSGRQPGSTFKPIVLATALHEGLSIKSTFPAPGNITLKDPHFGTWRVANAGDSSGGGSMDLLSATIGSVNTVYAQLIVKVGVEDTLNMARQMGVTSPLQPVPSIALGAGEVSPLEMASVFSTFPNRGRHPAPTVITEVKTASGKVIEHFTPQKAPVLTEAEADTVTYALEGVVERGTGTAARLKGVPTAGKTGTTQDYGDAWFVGYTPRYTTAVWVGFKEGATKKKLRNVHGITVFGGTFPARIWKAFMERAMEGVDPGEFVKPAKLGGKRVTSGSAKRKKTPTPGPSASAPAVEPTSAPAPPPAPGPPPPAPPAPPAP